MRKERAGREEGGEVTVGRLQTNLQLPRDGCQSLRQVQGHCSNTDEEESRGETQTTGDTVRGEGGMKLQRRHRRVGGGLAGEARGDAWPSKRGSHRRCSPALYLAAYGKRRRVIR